MLAASEGRPLAIGDADAKAIGDERGRKRLGAQWLIVNNQHRDGRMDGLELSGCP